MRRGIDKRPVLVYASELSKSVKVGCRFDAIIPVRRLLGMDA